MRDITRIFIHCTAGYGNYDALKAHWKRMGWKSEGYHRIINLDGSIIEAVNFDNITNGVKGFNARSIHIAYIGGVERNNVNKAADTRTDAQKESLITCINEALSYCKNVKQVRILGHRDISPDKNLNGRIDSWERIKECPSFEVSEVIKTNTTRILK